MKDFQVNLVKAKQMKLFMYKLLLLADRRKYIDTSKIKMHSQKHWKNMNDKNPGV